MISRTSMGETCKEIFYETAVGSRMRSVVGSPRDSGIPEYPEDRS
jgi:hypothetical protein